MTQFEALTRAIEAESLRRELAETHRLLATWKGHWEDLNRAEGGWKRRCEELEAENDRLRELIATDRRARLANQRADRAEALLRAMGSVGCP